MPSLGREVGSHRRSHAAEAHETDFAHDRLAASRSSVAPLARQIPGCTCEDKRRAWLVLGHGDSWPGATSPFDDAHLATGISRYLVTGVSCPLSQLAVLLSFLAWIFLDVRGARCLRSSHVSLE